MVDKVHPVGPHNHEVPNRAAAAKAEAGKTTPTIGAGVKKKKTAAALLYPKHKKASDDDTNDLPDGRATN